MGSVNVLKELEELRSMLDTPKKVYTPGSRLDDSDGAGDAGYYAAGRTSLQVTPTAQPITGSASRGPQYAHALNHAERSADRLGKAIELAEEEMDAALKRTTDVHRSQLKSKEAELREMQRLMQDKERAVSSLRDTLATTKRTYEGRVSQLEGSLAMKDADISALREELSVARAEAEGLAYTARRESAAVGHELDSLRMREAELATTARARSDELSRLSSQLRTERDERRAAVGAAEELRRTVAVLQEELGSVKARSSAEIDALQRRLKAERSIRKACEKVCRSRPGVTLGLPAPPAGRPPSSPTGPCLPD
uniref:Uncharacterized protein n=1 Tax=Chlamydomonas euryale TaxID=1486919 RepID=A0A7R9YSB7_9CHLO